MEAIVIELSRYLFIILLTIYTIYSFTVFRYGSKEKQRRIYTIQRMLSYLLHFIAHGILFLHTNEMIYIYLYVAELLFVIIVSIVYRFVYQNLSQLILNHMILLLLISFTMLGRLKPDYAKRQLMMAAIGFFVCLIIPFLIEKIKYLDHLGWIYAAIGLILLVLVFLPGIGVEKYGSFNWIQIAGYTLQPSEFVKIIFVFFVASLLSKRTDFKRVALVSVIAAIYVLVLVVERDLGGALLYFITYLSVLYVASRQPFYFLSGIGAISVAGAVSYRLFAHVRTRFLAWKDPFSDINDGGYQICSSLFAIGTGGWFGMGLGKGLPTSIPVQESDFIFSAISEEFGGIFAFCLILIYISCFLMFVNIAMKMKHSFYKLTAFGLSVLFLFQVFLNIGGVTKFVPSTGVTLPLVSYGGSSILSVIAIFSIIQGMYVKNQEGKNKKDEE